MKITLWGTRGSLPSAGPETVRYGGNSSCVEVQTSDGSFIVLDAGTGIRRLGAAIGTRTRRVHILLTHLHMDHIQGLGFFDPLQRSEVEVHIWGPPSTTHDLRTRLTKYLSPPLFPVRLRDLPSRVQFHDVSITGFAVNGVRISCGLVCHPGPTVGYRIEERGKALVYLPDHEPALGARSFPPAAAWTSGFDLAKDADLLIHDSQYTDAEYQERPGWGHSSLTQAVRFASLARVKRLITFHHDPSHSDELLDGLMAAARDNGPVPFELIPGQEGASFDISR